jgi:hypothetical protein
MYSSTQQVDDYWDDYFAASDANRERYATETQDIKTDNHMKQWYEEYMTKVWDAGYGADADAYEGYWSRLFKYYEHDR